MSLIASLAPFCSKIIAGLLLFSSIDGSPLSSGPELWIDVPFVQAGNPFCGHACASMLLQYWGQKGYPSENSDLTQVKEELRWNRTRGVSSGGMVDFFLSRRFQAITFRGSQEELRSQLLKGRPMIVGLGKSNKGIFHFVVVVGMEPSGRYMLVNDPAVRKMVKSPWEDFKREWTRTGLWTLLVLPPVTPK